MKTKRFLLAASLALALAFTLSCSDSGNDSGGGDGNNPVVNPGGVVNPSDHLSADRQGYLIDFDIDDDATRKFDGGGIVYLRTYNATYGEIEIGKIESGKLKLTLPDIKKDYSELLDEWEFCDYEESYGSCKTAAGHSVSPAGLSYFQVEFEVDASNNEQCDIGLYLAKSNKWQETDVSLYYFSALGSITGTETESYKNYDGDEESYTRNFNLSFSEGWNFAYNVEGNNRVFNVTTSLPAGNTLEWGINCYSM